MALAQTLRAAAIPSSCGRLNLKRAPAGANAPMQACSLRGVSFAAASGGSAALCGGVPLPKATGKAERAAPQRTTPPPHSWRLSACSAASAVCGGGGDRGAPRSCCCGGAHRPSQHRRRAARAAAAPDTPRAAAEPLADALSPSEDETEDGYEDDIDDDSDGEYESCTASGECCPWGWCEGDRSRHALLCRTSMRHFGVASLHLYSRAQLWLRGLDDPWARDAAGEIVAVEAQPVPPPELLAVDESTPEGKALLEAAEQNWAELAEEEQANADVAAEGSEVDLAALLAAAAEGERAETAQQRELVATVSA